MAAVTQPTLIPRPWAENGSKEVVPDTTSQFGRASWSAGFPAETARALSAGGIPPNWLDFQGVLNALSSHVVFEQAGGRYAWSDAANYPAGACIIGSNGIAYQALQESGPGTGTGAKNPVSAGNSAYWGPVASPDGTTIKLVNGKLSVDTGNLASTLADGTTITASNNKLSVGANATATLLADGTTITASNGKVSVGATATAALLADGTTITASGGKLSAVGGGGGGDASSLVDNVTTVNNNGKISVDLSSATTAALSGISQYLADSGGGLAMNESTGKLMQTLRPTTENLAFYVAGTGDDTIVAGRGSESLPFATISACVHYIAANYILYPYDVTVYVSGGTYQDYISPEAGNLLTSRAVLGEKTIIIQPKTNTDTVIITNRTSSGTIANIQYSHFSFRNIIFSITYSDSGTETVTPLTFVASRGGLLSFLNCAFNVVFSGSGGSSLNIRVFYAYNKGRIKVTFKDISPYNAFSCTPNGTTVHVFYAEKGGEIDVDDPNTGTCTISGSASYFLHCASQSQISFEFSNVASGTFTATKYLVKTGGLISAHGTVPGSTSGTADSTTYGIYETY